MKEIMETVLAKDAEGFAVDDSFVEAVEERVGMGCGAWDTIRWSAFRGTSPPD